MSNQPPLIQYSKKGPPYVTTGGLHHDDVYREPTISDVFSITSEERCAIRGCANTFTTQPPKIFVPFPIQPSRRSKWLKVVGLDPANPPSHKLFCCEDHFDLKKDVMYLSTLRSVNSGIVPNLLKEDVLPHRNTNINNPVAADAASRPSVRVKSSPESISSTTSLIEHNCTTPAEAHRRTSVIQEPVIPTSVIQTTPQVIKTDPQPSFTKPLVTPQVRNGMAQTEEVVKLKYRECAVTGCPHNLRTFPDIQLVCVPIQEKLRKEWYNAIGRPFTKKSLNENIYICTDHFLKEQLKTIKPTYGKKGRLGPTNFHIRVEHGVRPTLKLGPEYVQTSGSCTSRAAQLQRVPDLTPHFPSVLMTGSVGNQASSEVESHETKPQAHKYVAKSMPQYPDCKHNGEPYQCSTLSVMDCSSFYSQFYSLDTRDQQNEFIYSHTKMVFSSSSELKKPVFQFFIDQKKSPGVNKCVLVCAHAFSTCLSFEITTLLSLVTRFFSIRDPNPATVLKPVKIDAGNASEDDDIMIYEPVPLVLEIVDSSDEEKPVPGKVDDSGRGVESDLDLPLTVEEELRQTDQRISECQGESENLDWAYNSGNETSTFETVHICTRCLAQFKSKVAFDEHASQITPCDQFIGDVFKCTTCGRTLTSFEDLKVHTTVFHKYVCPKCSDTFRYRRYLEDHVVKCSGTNKLSEEMSRLVARTKAMQNKIADQRGLMESQPTSKMPALGCSVVLQRLKLPSDEKRMYQLNQQTCIVDVKTEDLPRLKIRAASTNPAVSPVSYNENNVSSTSPAAGDSHGSTEPEEEVDVESTSCTTEPDDNLKEPPSSTKKRSKRKLSSSSEEVVKNNPRQRRSRRKPSDVEQNTRTTRELRARRPISLAEPDTDSDTERIPELASSGGDSELDPDFDPNKCDNQKGKRRRRRSDSESSSGSGSSSTKVSACKKTDPFSVKCGRCSASFSEISGLLAHHRLPEKCGKFVPGTVFKCDSCRKMFISQAMLDEHHATAKNCHKPRLTPTPVGTASGASSVVSERRPHNLASGPHICKGCKVVFNSALGLGLHLKRSRKCIVDNPNVDIPGVVDKSSVVDSSSGAGKNNADLGVKSFLMRGIKRTGWIDPDQDLVYVCVKCHSAFSSVWGLRTHERNSTDCKPDRPYEIPVPVPKEQAEKQKREFLAKQQKERKQVSSIPSSSSSKGAENNAQKPGFMMVYTQESLDEDGKFKCKTCSALFTSVWGLRTHHRISESCMEKTKIILSEAAAKSIAKGENICPNCSAKFSTSWGLRTHLRTSSLCSDSETNIKALDSKRAKEGQILTCSNCEMIFVHLKQLRDHVKYSPSCLPEDVTIAKNGRVQPGAGCFMCPLCPKTFKLPFSLEQHFIEHAPRRKDWVCHLCDKDFPDRNVMHRHFHREHIGKWFCIMCGKKSVLTTFKEFYAHIFATHTTGTTNIKERLKCTTCYKSFKSKFSYDFHVYSCKKLAEQVFRCVSCQKVFNKKIHISNHMKYAHAGVDVDERYKFKCPNCPRRFLSKKEYLKNHQNECCVEEEIPCEICGEMYVGFDKLKMHLEIAHKKRSELHARKSPEPGRKSLQPDGRPVLSRHLSKPVDVTSTSVSPAPSSSTAAIQESPASPDSAAAFSLSSVKIEPSSP